MKNEKWTRKNGAAVEGFEKWGQSPIFWPRKIGDCPYFSDSDINWFRIVSGNDGGRFRTSVGAVINLYRWRLDEVIKPLHESEYRKSFVPWCKDHHYNRMLFFDENRVGSPPGFGRTDGNKVRSEW